GTIVSVRSQNGVSTVYVENTLRQVLVNGVDTPSGHKAVIYQSGALPAIEVIQPQDRRDLGRDLAFAGGRGTAAAAPEPGLPIAGPGPDLLNTLTTLEATEDTSLPGLALNDMMNPEAALPMPPAPPVPTTGTVSGTLISNPLTGFAALAGGTINYADYSFDVDLASGSITNAWMRSEVGTGSLPTSILNSFAVSGGTGNLVAGGTTDIRNFSGITRYGTNASPYYSSITDPPTGIYPPTTMTVTANVVAVGGTASGTYAVHANVVGNIDSGTFSDNIR
ncbi:MAG: hypothetical protein LBJ14_01825, partial [Desulfarculales bacterium]|nr:hypothetical protein [Desulfarculales bacterium]